MLNKWEQSIVDRLRYGLQNRQPVTLGADEVHIAANAIVERDELKERCAAAEADIAHNCKTCSNREDGYNTEPCKSCRKTYYASWTWRGPQSPAGQEGAEHD